MSWPTRKERTAPSASGNTLDGVHGWPSQNKVRSALGRQNTADGCELGQKSSADALMQHGILTVVSDEEYSSTVSNKFRGPVILRSTTRPGKGWDINGVGFGIGGRWVRCDNDSEGDSKSRALR